jgi:transcription initiation factor TFIIE subunit alpha
MDAQGKSAKGDASKTILTEIPSSLKQLARLVVRGFYSIEDALIVDMMVRYPCMREDDLCNLLKFDRKTLRAKISGLRSDKFLQVKPRIETNEDNKVVKMNCYFINYKVIRTFLLTFSILFSALDFKTAF